MFRTARLRVVAIVFLSAIIVITGPACERKEPTQPSATQPSRTPSLEGDYQIGAILPLTGSAAVWGQNAKMGMELALEELNAGREAEDFELKIIYEDSQSEPKIATSALHKLISMNKIQCVIGDIASSSVLAMAPIAVRNKVVLFSPGASNPDISQAGAFIFRNWQSDALEGDIDARFAIDRLKWQRAACLYVNNAYGTGLMKVFSARFEALGGAIVANEAVSQGATDVRAQITRLLGTDLNGVYMPGYPPEMAVALKQMKELGAAFQVLSVQAFDDPEILQRAAEAAEGVHYSVPTPPNPEDPIVKSFRASYAKKYRKEPGVCSDTGYDAVRILHSIVKEGATTGPQIRDQLNALKDFPGAAGPTTFDEHGDVIRDFSFLVIRSGKPVPVTGAEQP